MERRIFAKQDGKIYDVAKFSYSNKNHYFAFSDKKLSGLHESRHQTEYHLKDPNGQIIFEQETTPFEKIENFDGYQKCRGTTKKAVLSKNPSQKTIKEKDIVFNLNEIRSNTIGIALTIMKADMRNEEKFKQIFSNRLILIFKEYDYWFGLAIY